MIKKVELTQSNDCGVVVTMSASLLLLFPMSTIACSSMCATLE